MLRKPLRACQVLKCEACSRATSSLQSVATCRPPCREGSEGDHGVGSEGRCDCLGVLCLGTQEARQSPHRTYSVCYGPRLSNVFHLMAHTDKDRFARPTGKAKTVYSWPSGFRPFPVAPKRRGDQYLSQSMTMGQWLGSSTPGHKEIPTHLGNRLI